MSKKAHAIKTTKEAETFADGIAVKVPGEITFSLIDKYVDDIVVVDDEAIASTILMLLERAKLMVEGAGAISLAAVLNDKIPAKGKIVSVISGGNVDVNFISRIIERGLVKAGRRVCLQTVVVDRPGNLQRLLASVAQAQANVLYVSHDRVERNVPLGQAAVEIGLETRDVLHTEQIMASLLHEGYNVEII
ncbi:MAG: pyridoxal-phosphate dependent enzyme, partial [Sporomusa sp.]